VGHSRKCPPVPKIPSGQRLGIQDGELLRIDRYPQGAALNTDYPAAISNPIDQGTASRLRRFNTLMGLLHLVQGIAVLALTNDFVLPVTATFLEGPPGGGETALVELFEVRLGWGVALFLFMSAAAHWFLASPLYFARYIRNLEERRNYARWVEYAFSSSVMMVLIAMLTGISTIGAVTAIFAVNATMILFGWLMEKYEQPGNASWLAFTFGSLAGIVPWGIISLYLWSPGTDASPPGFVYGIFISLFVLFNIFAVNMVLQYRRVGRWQSYVFGERAYIVLSLVAKSLLAWQVFIGTLAS